MKELAKHIIDERTGLKYELVGDYYIIAGDDEAKEQCHIGIWGQRHGRYLKQNNKAVYTGLLIGGDNPCRCFPRKVVECFTVLCYV